MFSKLICFLVGMVVLRLADCLCEKSSSVEDRGRTLDDQNSEKLGLTLDSYLLFVLDNLKSLLAHINLPDAPSFNFGSLVDYSSKCFLTQHSGQS